MVSGDGPTQLAAGERLAIDTKYGKRASILSANGEGIVKDLPVRTVGINKDGLAKDAAKSSAEALAALLDIDAAAYLAKVEAYGPVAFVDAITLREEAFKALDQNKLNAIDGVLATPGTLPLAPSRTFAAALLGTVHEATAEDIEKSEGKVVAGQIVRIRWSSVGFRRTACGNARGYHHRRRSCAGNPGTAAPTADAGPRSVSSHSRPPRCSSQPHPLTVRMLKPLLCPGCKARPKRRWGV